MSIFYFECLDKRIQDFVDKTFAYSFCRMLTHFFYEGLEDERII